VGSLELAVPKLRSGSSFTSILELGGAARLHSAVCTRVSRMAFWLVWTRRALPPGEAHAPVSTAVRLLFAPAAAAQAQARAAADRTARTSRLLALSTFRDPGLARPVP
jgi:hypothetical protein